MRRIPGFTTALASLAILLATAACRSGPAPVDAPRLPSVTGMITLEGETTVPSNASLAVRLVDLERTDPSRVVIEQVTSSPERFPLRYRLYYRPASIDYTHDYGVEAEVVVNGRPTWKQAAPNPVLTKDRPVVANIVLQREK